MRGRFSRSRWRVGALVLVCVVCAALVGTGARAARGQLSGRGLQSGAGMLHTVATAAQQTAPSATASAQGNAHPGIPAQTINRSDVAPAANLMPARLVIPELGLDASVLSLGPDASGAMQAPREGGPKDPIWSNVYWWNVGAAPGQIGNAVIAGHVNRPDGSPATFTHLNRLQPGDEFAVVTVGGTTLHFRVTAKDDPEVYVHTTNDPIIERIFGPASAPQLNLLTCWGEWDGQQYNRRLVIYSTLVGTTPSPAQGAAPGS